MSIIADPNMKKIFKQELQALNKHKLFAEDTSLSEHELRQHYQDLVRNYHSLLQGSIKITSIGDINQKKLVDNLSLSLEEHAKYLETLLHAYGRFVPHSFLELLNKDSIIDLKLGDHIQQEMTVLFADIRSFTALSETMTPKENFDFVNAFLHRVGPVIRTHGGIIDKYIGDAVMALFPNSPDNAIKAAINMQRKVTEYNKQRHKKGFKPIAIGIGLHTGNLILGIVGEAERMNSTVIADAVNLASHLERATKYYGAGVLVSEHTIKRLKNPNLFKIRFLDKVQVKGKQQSVNIYQIIDKFDTIFSCPTINLTLWQTAVELYFDQKLSEALPLFQDILQQNPNDCSAKLYIERINQLINTHSNQDWYKISITEN